MSHVDAVCNEAHISAPSRPSRQLTTRVARGLPKGPELDISAAVGLVGRILGFAVRQEKIPIADDVATPGCVDLPAEQS